MLLRILFRKFRNYLFLKNYRKAYRDLILFQNLQEKIHNDMSFKDYFLKNFVTKEDLL